MRTFIPSCVLLLATLRPLMVPRWACSPCVDLVYSYTQSQQFLLNKELVNPGDFLVGTRGVAVCICAPHFALCIQNEAKKCLHLF